MKKFLAKIGHFFKNCWKKVAGFFARISRKIKSTKVYTLVMMQLKDKWNISFKANKKASLFKLVGYLILFGAITAIVYLLMSMSATRLGIFIESRIPVNAMIPLIGVVLVFEFISTLIGLTKALFFAKDNVVLITYPVKSHQLFLSKLIVYYIDALKKSLTLFIPIVFSFGIIYGYGFYFYLWVLFLDLLIVAIIVLFSGLLAIPAFFVMKFLSHYRIIQALFYLAILGLIIYLAIKLMGVIPTNINLISEYEKFSISLNSTLYWFANTFNVLKAITFMFCGQRNGLAMNVFSTYSWAGFLIAIALIAILILGNMFLSKPFYSKMIASNNSNRTSLGHKHKNHRHSRYFSVLNYEMLRIVRNEKFIVASIISVAIMPLITLIFNRVYNSIPTRQFGDQMVYVFNFFFIFIVAASHNVTASYIFSKDGPSWTVNKTIPANPQVSLTLRLVYNAIVSLAIIIPSSILFFKNYQGDSFSIVFFVLSLIALTLIHLFMSASYDFSHSQNKDKADIGSEIINGHEAVSLGIAFLIGLAAVLVHVIFLTTQSTNPGLRFFILVTLGLALVIYYFLKKVRVTYQEN